MGSTLAAFRLIAARTGTSAVADLKREECLHLAIQAAFPLPKTGTFGDLVAALDEVQSPIPEQG